MSHVYTGSTVGAVVAAYTFPDDGDGPPKVADYNVPGEGMADDIARLNAKVTGGAQARIFQDFSPAYTGGVWDLSTTNGWAVQLSSGSSAQLRCNLRIPAGATITQIEMLIDPPAGHAALPVSMPQLELMEYDAALGTNAVIAAVVDNSASVVLYEPQHLVTSTPFSHVVNRAVKNQWARIRGESGGNAVDLLAVKHVKVFYTVANIDKGAG